MPRVLDNTFKAGDKVKLKSDFGRSVFTGSVGHVTNSGFDTVAVHWGDKHPPGDKPFDYHYKDLQKAE